MLLSCVCGKGGRARLSMQCGRDAFEPNSRRSKKEDGHVPEGMMQERMQRTCGGGVSWLGRSIKEQDNCRYKLQRTTLTLQVRERSHKQGK